MENLEMKISKNKKTESFWQNRPILVTGGAGFIGSHLVKELLNLGAKIVVLDLKLSSPILDSLEKKPILIQGDARDRKLLEDLIKNYKIKLIFHLAAQPIVEAAYFDPWQTLENNILSTVAVLETARKMSKVIDGVVVTSSDKAYGKAKSLPYKEDYPLQGDHPYDVSKTATDLIAQTYFKTYNLPIAITRFGNTFGPGDLNFNRIIPGTFESIIKNEELLIRSDGKMIREYVYVKDIIDGCIKLAQNIDKIKGEAFNFGSENIFSVIDVVKKIEEILNVKVNYKILNVAKNEIPEQYLDWTKARELLNWRPETSFEEGIKGSLNWYRKFLF